MLVPGRAQAQALADDIHETVERIPVTLSLASGKRHSGQMVVTHFRPNGPGPFPVVIYAHGRNGQEEGRTATPRFRNLAMARFLVRRGFSVFIPTRLGYGDSGVDPDPEHGTGACAVREYGPILNVMLVQTEAALTFAKSFPWVDGRRVLVVGQSYGGYAAIGASGYRPLGAIATINFAGGAGGNPERTPRQPCGGPQIGESIASAGKQSVPMLWLYSENDKYWGADWPRKWHAAYVKGGGKAEFVMFPPVDDDGHKLIGKGFRLWRPVVDRFLQKVGFATPKTPNAPAPTDFARLEDSSKLPYVNEAVKAEGYQKFLDADVPRAFVLSTAGAWGWQSGENAVARAMDRCKQNSKGTCLLYAVDDTVVFKPPASAEATPAR